MKSTGCAAALLVWLGAALGAGPARAASIRYETFEFPVGPSGEDVWQYRYTLDVAPDEFNPDQGFAIEFDPALYASIQSFDLGGWDILVLQPDLELPAPGIFDALALYGVEQSQSFVVSFEWLGGTAKPGSQPFSIYQLDEDGLGLVTILSTGTTQPVPEPAPVALFAVVMGGLAALRARSGCPKASR